MSIEGIPPPWDNIVVLMQKGLHHRAEGNVDKERECLRKISRTSRTGAQAIIVPSEVKRRAIGSDDTKTHGHSRASRFTVTFE